jgi:PAS domain-containing protein
MQTQHGILTIGTVRDITERQRAAELLRRSELPVSALLEQAPDGIRLTLEKQPIDIVVQVANHGAGLDPQQINSLFQRF